jgi:hypothetical protein
MTTDRNQLIQWARSGHLPAHALPEPFRVAGLLPGPADWGRFLDRLALAFGIAAVATGTIFLVAFNWDAIGRFPKLEKTKGYPHRLPNLDWLS